MASLQWFHATTHQRRGDDELRSRFFILTWSDWWHKQKKTCQLAITSYLHSYHTRKLLPNTHHEMTCFSANMSTRFLFFGSKVTKPLLKNLHLLSLHFSRFQRFRCSTVGIFVAASTVLQVWTLSDVLSLCCGRDFDHVIWGADKLWRYLTAYFLILKVYIKLYVRTTNIAHHIRIEIYRNLNMNLFFFFSHLLLFFSFLNIINS